MHIVLEYQLTPGELVRSRRLTGRRSRMLAWILAAVAGLCSLLEFALGAVFLGGVVLAGAVIYVLAILSAPRLAVRQQAPRVCRPTTTTLTDAGMTVRTEQSGGEHTWSAFARTRETAEFFILYYDERLVCTLPKRAFTPAQAAEFAAFLTGTSDGFRN